MYKEEKISESGDWALYSVTTDAGTDYKLQDEILGDYIILGIQDYQDINLLLLRYISKVRKLTA